MQNRMLSFFPHAENIVAACPLRVKAIFHLSCDVLALTRNMPAVFLPAIVGKKDLDALLPRVLQLEPPLALIHPYCPGLVLTCRSINQRKSQFRPF